MSNKFKPGQKLFEVQWVSRAVRDSDDCLIPEECEYRRRFFSKLNQARKFACEMYFVEPCGANNNGRIFRVMGVDDYGLGTVTSYWADEEVSSNPPPKKPRKPSRCVATTQQIDFSTKTPDQSGDNQPK